MNACRPSACALPIGVVLLMASACGHAAPPVQAPSSRGEGALSSLATPTTEEAEALRRSTSSLGLRVYAALATDTENLVLSPVGLQVALLLAAEGASGSTAAQLREVLYEDRLLEGFHRAQEAWLRQLPRSREVGATFASRVFLSEALEPTSGYRGWVRGRFGADLERLPFQEHSGQSGERIGAWLQEATEGRAQLSLAEDELQQTHLLLLTYLRFYGRWREPFGPARPDSFLSVGEEVLVPTMGDLRSTPYADVGEAQVAELLYADPAYSMLLVLPREGPPHALPLEEQLDGWIDALEPHSVSFSIPKFQIESAPLDASRALREIGLRLPFDPEGADFGRLARGGELSLRRLDQHVRVAIDEHGTEAEAVTEATAEAGGSLERISMRLDHPFFFAIRDRRDGTLLFLGQVCHPATSE